MKNNNLDQYKELKDFYDLDKNKQFLITIKGLIVHKNKILVVKDSVGRRLWGLPGGLLEYNETLEDCLKREIKEEVNLDINVLKIHNVSSVYRDKKFLFKDGRQLETRVIEIYYLCEKLTDDIKFDWEVEDYKWVSNENYQELTYYQTSEETIKKYFN
jgi:8-oxo-dGTP diphosphatase